MYSSQRIIDIKNSGLNDTGNYPCIVLRDGGKIKLNNAALEPADNAERMIAAGKEEGNSSSENRAEKHVSVTSLVVSSRTTQIESTSASSSCFQDLCPSTHGSGEPENVSHHFGAAEQTCRPVFLEKPKSLTTSERECVRFTCRLKGQPIPVVRWEKDGRQITGDRVQITSDGTVFSLSIPCSTISDAGRYVCIAVNDAGEARSMVSLIVQKASGQTSKFSPTDSKPSVNARSQIRTFNLRPMDQFCSKTQSLQKNPVEVRTKPSVMFQHVDYSALVGARISMSCSVSGIPEPKVTWFRETRVIEPSEAVKISCCAGVSSLELASVSSVNGGTYICQAENDLGTSSAKCHLMIQKQPTAAEMVHDHLAAKSSGNSALQQHGENTVTVTDINAMTGLSDSSKGELLESYDVLNMPAELSGNEARLKQLHSVNSNDSFPESSKVVSSSTQSSQSAVLYSPSIDSYPKETESKARSSGKTSDCGVNGDDADDDAFERPSNETNLRCNDEPPLIEDLQPENMSLVCGSKFQLIAKFWGQPVPQVNWYKGNEPLTLSEDNRIKFETKPHCSILTVMNAKPQDTGIYALVLSNKFGHDRQFSSVTIEDKPEPPVGPPAVTSILDNSLVLSWSGSSYDGGCPVLKYKVEVSRDNTNIWECLTDDCQHTTYQVLKLVPNTEYVFRVSAANKHGFSIPGELSHPVVTNGVKNSASVETSGKVVQKEAGNIFPSPQMFYGPVSPLTLLAAREDFPFLPRVVAIEKDRKFADFYALGEEIGKGKFGSVYKCSDKLTGRLFAAKFIHTKTSGQSSEYLQELEVMNELHHPKLLLLWDAFESRKEIVLVTEHVSGGELMERIINDDYVLTERECIHFMRQICEGAMYMHSCNILHLDLKPENILCITPNSNEIKIIDFGLARKFDPDKEFRIMFGTAEFVAPEVINYDTIGYTTDMWSIGVICYVLLSGLSPFLGDNDKETFVNVTKAQFDYEDSFDDITADAKDFIDKLLVKDPKKRLLSQESLKHQWLAQDVTYMRAKKISTHKHKKFMARSKWQKTGHALMALRRMVELQRASFSHAESCRSTSSLSSHTDSHSVGDPNERMSESDDSGFNSCQIRSVDSKNMPVVSKDLEALANAETMETSKSGDLAVGVSSSLQIKSDAEVTSEEASLTENRFVSEVSPTMKTKADVFGGVLKSSVAETVCERMDFERKEEKEMTENCLIPAATAKDSAGAKTEGKCMQFEDICIENMERKKIRLPMRKEAVQTESSSCTNEPDISCKQLPEPAVSQPADQKRKLFARKSCDVQTASKLNDTFSRSFDQSKSVRVSEKLKQARNVFDNPGSPATFQRNTLYYASQGRGSVKPREFKCGAKAGLLVDDSKKPHTTLNSKNAESTSVAARKLAVQQFSAQRNTKPKKAPTFVRRMKNLDVVEGNAAKFEIVVDGNPPPTVSWLKDGKEIPLLPQKYRTELHDSGKHSLTIVNCGEDDDAEYGCKASNSLGAITNKANLYVEPVGEVLDCNNIPQNLQK